ncbi:MAG: glutamate dehydrogenase (NAD(P)+) [Alphaproteobacteria bacterium]|jgi:glutamate dehydrogenase (NAD(P)+)
MQDPFALGDEFGPARIVHVQIPKIGLKGVLVVDNVAAGPSIGGLRMAKDVSAEECSRLARAMTLKNAAAGLPHGGGKSVLIGDPKMPLAQKEQWIRGFATALRDIDDYIFGPDMGTDELCMAWVKDEIGRSVGLPREIGGIPLDEIGATGFGVCRASEIACAHAGINLKGARIAVQGFGVVGSHAARFLTEKGAILVAASDSHGTLVNPRGLDIKALENLKLTGKSVADLPGGTRGGIDDILDVECDIWIPAARPDVVREDNVDRLRARIVVQGANIPFTLGAERVLFERGVLVVPDFIANAGGVICAAMEYAGALESAAFAAIEEKISRNTEEVLENSKKEKITPRDAANALALKRIKRAMTTRRWGVF